MSVVNFRTGFATNSSSSHSIVLLKYPVKSELANQSDYGWENFCLTTKEEKAHYMAVNMSSCLERAGGDKKRLEDAFSTDLGDGASVEHQSVFNATKPYMRRQKKSLLYPWVVEHVIENPDVAIFGGNDNDEYPLEWMRGHELLPVPFSTSSDLVFKLDGNGTLVTFDFRDGTRVRYDSGGIAPSSTDLPDLVDLKITDRCQKGCSHCYQNSGPDGEHASYKRIAEFASNLQNLGVFEVAIGGGEPTEHPDFMAILSMIRAYGPKPSFSTGTMDWLGNEAFVNCIRKTCGAVAFSTNSVEEACRWFEESESLSCDPLDYTKGAQIAIHYTLGLNPVEDLGTFLQGVSGHFSNGYMSGRLVLLNWKECGRAGKAPYSTDGWCEVLRSALRGMSVMDSLTLRDDSFFDSIAVDSFLIPDVVDNLKEVHPVLCGRDDGHFSFYYDAVKNVYAAHSALPGSEFAARSPKVAWSRIVKENE